MNSLDIYPDIMEAPVEIRLYWAKNTDCPLDVLEQLSQDNFWYVRDFVASNSSTPVPILEKLTQDPTYRVRYDAHRTLQKMGVKEETNSLDSKILAAGYRNSRNTVSRNSRNSIKNPKKILPRR